MAKYYGMDEEDLEPMTQIPLNVRDVVTSRMRGMNEGALERVIPAACALYLNSSEAVGMLTCLYTATEWERQGRD